MTIAFGKQQRFLDVSDMADGFLSVRVGRDHSTYFIGEIRTDVPGERAFEVKKISGDGGLYHARTRGGRPVHCSCETHEQKGRCGHADAIVKLIQLGCLPEKFGRDRHTCKRCGRPCEEWEGRLHRDCAAPSQHQPGELRYVSECEAA